MSRCVLYFFFFFSSRRRHTRSLCDWSSDVCSSDLAELSLAADPDPRGFVAGFAGDDRAVADYLTAEVVSRLTAEDRGLLLRTSVATRVNGELADALTGSNGGARKLRELARAIGFLKPVPGRGSWYRCHQLLADVMQAELRHRMPDEVQALHRI